MVCASVSWHLIRIDLSLRETISDSLSTLTRASLSDDGRALLLDFYHRATMLLRLCDVDADSSDIGILDCMHYIYWCLAEMGRRYNMERVGKFL